MTSRTLLLVGALGLFTVTVRADAQGRSPITFDATIGKGARWTDGSYREPNPSATLDAGFAIRVRKLAYGALVASIYGGIHGGVGSGSFDCIREPTDYCPPEFPIFEMVGATLGWQDSNAIVRASAGAAYVQADWDGWSVAWQSRVDLAVPTTWHVSPVMSFRGTLIPNYPNGDSFRLFAFGFGLRIF